MCEEEVRMKEELEVMVLNYPFTCEYDVGDGRARYEGCPFNICLMINAESTEVTLEHADESEQCYHVVVPSTGFRLWIKFGES